MHKVSYTCKACFRSFPSSNGLTRHRSQNRECYQHHQALLARQLDQPPTPPILLPLPGYSDEADVDMNLGADLLPAEDEDMHTSDLDDDEDTDAMPPPSQPYWSSQNGTVTIEDVADDEELDGRQSYKISFPPEMKAGATFGQGRTSFAEIRDDQILTGDTILGPFKDNDKWELAKWLMKHAGHNAADEFLRMNIVSQLFYKHYLNTYWIVN